MPAAVAVPLITTGISAATSIGSSLLAKGSANKRAKEAQSLLDNYQRQDIVNPYENIQVSTLSADRQREDLARAIATNAQYAAMGGGRAIAGIAPQLVAQQNTQEAQILANLDEQEKQRQQLIARGDEMVQGMIEQRENNDLMGIGNSLNVARQEGVNAQNNLTSSLMTTGALALEANRQGLFSKGGSQNDIMDNKGIYRQNGVGKNMTNLIGADVSYNPIAFQNPLYQQQSLFTPPSVLPQLYNPLKPFG